VKQGKLGDLETGRMGEMILVAGCLIIIELKTKNKKPFNVEPNCIRLDIDLPESEKEPRRGSIIVEHGICK